MKVDARPHLAKGVKLRHDGDGSVMLLVPEGALVLNDSAAAALELVDGERTLAEIAATVVERFDVSSQDAQKDLVELFERLEERGFVQ
jgi:pyrroloquinoline quinone biosynthesis protein D